MKSKLLVLSFFLFQLPLATLQAQSWVKKTAKSVLTLKTFDANGTLLGSSGGVFIGEAGDAISSFAPFRGASSAVVIDAQGKEYPVEMLLGANDTYDVAKFRVTIKKPQGLTASKVKMTAGSPVYLLPYREMKTAVAGQLSKSETFGQGYDYYT